MKRHSSRPGLDARTTCRLGLLCVIAIAAMLPDAGVADADLTILGVLDLNGDRHISFDEFVHGTAVKTLRELDANQDGFLSPSEAASSEARRDPRNPALRFSEVDTNHDGRVSLEELKQALHANPVMHNLFEELDEDRDRVLSQTEAKRLWSVPLIRLQF